MIAQTAKISKGVKLGKSTKIWEYSQIREGTEIGNDCVIGRNVYIDHDTKIGSKVKIQNNALIYYKSILENGVFIGPAASLINDKYPRATNNSGKLKKKSDWTVGKILIKKGASIGAGAIILPNVTIGAYSLVGAGSVVTHSIPSYSKYAGNPAALIGFICKFGHNISLPKSSKIIKNIFCKNCQRRYLIKYE